MARIRMVGVPRWGAVLAPLALAALLIVSRSPYAIALLALALTGAAAAALAPAPEVQRLGVVGSLPSGFLLVVAWVLLWGLFRGWTGVGGWSSPLQARLGLAAFGLIALTVATRRGGVVHLSGRDWPALLGGSLLLGFGVTVVACEPLALWSRDTGGGTDFLRHLYAVREVLDSGGLTFGASGYPSGLHSTGAMLIAATGSGTTAEQLWIAIAGICWLMLCLMMVAIVAIAVRVLDRLEAPRAAGALAGLLAALAFVQTAWFSSFLHFGSVMNMLVAVAMLGLVVTGLEAHVYGSRTGSLVGASAVAVTANAWQLLLPVVAAGALVWFAQWWRRGRRRPLDWAVWFLGAVLTLNGALGVLSPGNSGVVSGATVSGLFAPDWWWLAAGILALILTRASYQAGLRSWACAFTVLLAAGIFAVAFLLRYTGSGWELMLYYPVKAMWTVLVLLIPVAAAGVVWIGVGAWVWARQRQGVLGPVGRLGLLATSALLMAGVLGRGAAFSPHLAVIADPAGMPNWSLAVVDGLRDIHLSDPQKRDAVVFGIVPSAPIPLVVGGYVGAVDYMVMESLGFTDVGSDPSQSRVKVALASRNMESVCTYLRDHPQSLRITGSNPRAGIDWIRDSGCPDEVVDSGTWLTVDIDPRWLQESPWQDPSVEFPTVSQVQDSTRST